MIEIKRNKKAKAEQQLKLGISDKPYIVSSLRSRLHKIKITLEVHPFWRSGFAWLGLLSVIILGGNSIYLIYSNIDKLPERIALLFAETEGKEILKDKYLLYFLPILLILIGSVISISLSKLFVSFPKLVKFIEVLIFILSLTQLFAVYKIISIYT